MHRLLSLATLLLLLAGAVRAQASEAVPDTAGVSAIIDEGTHRSRVMELLSWLTDVIGPRLTWSPEYARAAAWAADTLRAWGLTVQTETWEPKGTGWTLKRYSAAVTSPVQFPLHSFPRAWSNGTNGTVRGEIVRVDAENDSALQEYRGKLRNRFVLLGAPVTVAPHFQPLAYRETDSSLLAMANADPDRRQRATGQTPRSSRMQRMLFAERALQFCQEEGARAILTPSRGDGGTIFVQSVNVPDNPDVPFSQRRKEFEKRNTDLAPQVVVAAEHYNRLVRMLGKGEKVTIEMDLEVSVTSPVHGSNVIAELPGTDLKHEIVMLGGHLDSWHGGTGATDNATGVATSMEAVRLILASGLKPRRTIRIGLWGGEEQGLYGSQAYAKAHLGEAVRDTTAPGGRRITLLPDGQNFCAYFNNDNGSGRIRGIYLQRNEALRPIFRAWLEPFRSMGAATISPLSTGSTDHVSFNALNLPGFQFIQDDLEYFTRTWHSTSDLYDRIVEEDVKQAAIIMAAFAYNAAMRDEKLPRVPPAASQGQQRPADR